MEPADALILIAEVSVAIAGFSGIAIAVGRSSDASAFTIQRQVSFGYMLTQSGIALFAALIPLILLYWADVRPDVDAAQVWTGSSLFWAFFATIGVSTGYRNEGRFSASIGLEKLMLTAILGTFGLLILLQLTNAFRWKEFWPYLAAITGNLAFAFYHFMRIILPDAQPIPPAE